MFLHNTKAHFSFIDHSASWGLVQSAVPHNVQLHTPDSSQETKAKPVPPAIIATCLNLRTFGSDFLSGRMANWPVAKMKKKKKKANSLCESGCLSSLMLHHSDIYWRQRRSSLPFPLYTSSPLGPLKSIESPMAILSRCWDNFPPSGKEGWEFL